MITAWDMGTVPMRQAQQAPRGPMWTSSRSALASRAFIWLCDHYIDAADRGDPRFAPLRAENLSGLPPAIVVTVEFDPLRDEGDAYAAALQAAGVPTEYVRARGHTHHSLTMVDVVISGAPVRAQMADALRHFFVAARTPEPAP
jgi:acetyl esterase/lipase